MINHIICEIISHYCQSINQWIVSALIWGTFGFIYDQSFSSHFSHLIIFNIGTALSWLNWTLWWILIHTNKHSVSSHTYSVVWWHTEGWRWELQCWDQESCSEPLHYTVPCCLHGRRCTPSQWGCQCCSAWGSHRRWSPQERCRCSGVGGCSWLDVSGCQQCYLSRRKLSENIIVAHLQCMVCLTLCHTAEVRIKITLSPGWKEKNGSNKAEVTLSHWGNKAWGWICSTTWGKVTIKRGWNIYLSQYKTSFTISKKEIDEVLIGYLTWQQANSQSQSRKKLFVTISQSLQISHEIISFFFFKLEPQSRVMYTAMDRHCLYSTVVLYSPIDFCFYMAWWRDVAHIKLNMTTID